MSTLEQVYMEGGDVILPVFELFSAAWPETIVLVPDYVDHVVTTEDSRVLTAQACAIRVALPARDASGAQSLKFVMGGVRPEATRLVRAAQEARSEIGCTLRYYLASDLSEPARAPYYMIVRNYSASAATVEIIAGLFDMIEMRWPRVLYNSNTAPCLRYIQ